MIIWMDENGIMAPGFLYVAVAVVVAKLVCVWVCILRPNKIQLANLLMSLDAFN